MTDSNVTIKSAASEINEIKDMVRACKIKVNNEVPLTDLNRELSPENSDPFDFLNHGVEPLASG